MTRCAPLALLGLCLPLGAADLFREAAAWAPLPSRNTGLIADEQRPLRESGRRWYAQALVGASTPGRLNGTLLRERDHEPASAADVQGTIGLAWVEHGRWQGYFTSCMRASTYLRGGTDAQDDDQGSGLLAAGGGIMGSIGGGPFGVWGEAGRSSGRGTVLYGEAAFLLYHVVVETDDDVETLRHGLCFRWAGGPMARSPADDPWSFALAIDWARSEVDDGPRVGSMMGELTLGWRVAQHLLLTGQVTALEEALHPDGDDDGVVTGSLALGLTF